MELSDKCVKEISKIVDDEVARQTTKGRKRIAGLDKELQSVRQKLTDVKRELETEQSGKKIAEGRIESLQIQLRESQVSEKALKSALAESPTGSTS